MIIPPSWKATPVQGVALQAGGITVYARACISSRNDNYYVLTPGNFLEIGHPPFQGLDPPDMHSQIIPRRMLHRLVIKDDN